MASTEPGRIYVGVDLGGTRIRAVAVDGHLRVLGRADTLTGAEEGTDAAVGRIVACAGDVLRRLPTDEILIAGIGIGSAGLVDWRTGSVLLTGNLGWGNVPMRALLGDSPPGMRVVVDRDTNAAALAEARAGAARRFSDFLSLAVSTGIGGAIFLDGRLYRGATGSAGDRTCHGRARRAALRLRPSRDVCLRQWHGRAGKRRADERG